MDKEDSLKLNFVKRVASESNTLHAKIAKIALCSNEIDQLLRILYEQHQTNPKLFIKMLGDELYLEFLKVTKNTF